MFITDGLGKSVKDYMLTIHYEWQENFHYCTYNSQSIANVYSQSQVQVKEEGCVFDNQYKTVSNLIKMDQQHTIYVTILT